MNATSLPTLISSMLNLGGPDLIIIFLIISVFGAVLIVGIVLLVTSLNRRKPAQPPPPLPIATSAAERLQQLEQLKQQNLVTDAEYEEQRRRIISGV